ncbi:MAG: hypothetical protein D6689_22220 [Deltaproteobacteria bacterium]|nr:MAG: hypothetical protein D6689_22220 [Deltaproteobacteria bacterium]
MGLAALSPACGGGQEAGPDGGSSADAGPDGGAAVDDDRPVTFSPDVCQADLRVLREETFEVRDHPLAYDGDFPGFRTVSTPDGDAVALVSLIDDRVLAVEGQSVPRAPDEKLRLDSFTVVPDEGVQNDPDWPIAFRGSVRKNSFEVRLGLFRSDGNGGIHTVMLQGDPLSLGALSGPVSGISGERLGSGGELYAFVTLADDPARILVREPRAGSPIELVVAPGQTLPTGDPSAPAIVTEVRSVRPGPLGNAVVEVAVEDPTGTVHGFAWLSVDPLAGIANCLATDMIECSGGVLVANGESLVDFDSDGTTLAAVIATGATQRFAYKVVGTPTTNDLDGAVTVDGVPVTGGVLPRVCAKDGAIYFASTVEGNVHELFRIDSDGAIRKLTDFASLLQVDALAGEVPDEIRNLAVGYDCTVVMYTWGPSGPGSSQGYEGYWVRYADGDTMEIIDETPGRPNGAGDLHDVLRARSGIDPNADPHEVVNIGPRGEFYYVPHVAGAPGVREARYVVSTEPVNRCREPFEVNSGADTSDVAPGDGRCDTGATVGADRECTLRAALEETNALAGRDVVAYASAQTTALTRPLPAITSSLELRGNGTVDGSALSGDVAGLVIDADDVVVSGLVIANMPGDGIVARRAVVLSGVDAVDNCGWGVRAAADVRVEDGELSRNGAGCPGGGILVGDPAAPAQLRAANVTASDNGGPGVSVEGSVEVADVVVAGNAAQGLQVDADGPVATRVYVSYGVLEASDNGADGIDIGAGGLRARDAAVVSTGNCGWGLIAAGVVAFGGDETRSLIADNGTAAGCTGGGLLVAHDDDEADRSVALEHATIRDNGGPGVIANAAVRVDDVEVSGNDGPGITVQALDDSDARIRLDSLYGDLVVSGNAGSGIETESGSVYFDETAATVTDNGGWGIITDVGQVYLGGYGASARTAPHVVARNGGGAQCTRWTLAAGPNATATSVPCAGGGVAILGWDPTSGTPRSHVDLIEVRDNQGPGILTSDELQVDRATVIGNQGEGIAFVVGEDVPDIAPVHFELGPSEIASNAAEGVRVEEGDVTGLDTVTIRDNAAAGVAVLTGDVWLPESAVTGVTWQTRVTGNGGGTTCPRWRLDATGVPLREDVPCSTGGIRVDAGDVTGIEVFVTGNTGVGIEARDGDEVGAGNITLTLGQLCGNSGGDTALDGTLTTTSVDTTCP